MARTTGVHSLWAATCLVALACTGCSSDDDDSHSDNPASSGGGPSGTGGGTGTGATVNGTGGVSSVGGGAATAAGGLAGTGGSSEGTGGSGGSGAGGTQGFNAVCSASLGTRCTCAVGGQSPPIITCSVGDQYNACCADSDYPASGICSCMRYYCSESLNNCTCTPDGSAGSSSCAGSFTYCCFDSFLQLCSCSNLLECDAGEIAVAHCALNEVPLCDSDEKAVASCTD
ncbi:MAG: hypothetical protein JW940_22580 [Polyangiaceae bacterium]|nr:hypothetical protein [Polyangiaceae bacterium]